tara:strand:+ start:24 stop:164 length:141 start_codon:yes stop_codon:yes gene_type:complete
MTIEQQLFQLLVLIVVGAWVYSSYKKQTMKDTFIEFRDFVNGKEDE